ncbi:DUF3396 domain-containing protein [Myxococcus llanfairpwllgwyngyllgogerychwyrndrobwllllantysiliogogogochensis]|uniref:DUF3396 domain-containing protein n=1 Tax=Myxococcus llanfairpwllgwyngyllgogerychwyrndrobwllllantysiliogogogochensis TaxID=2590453 RepID=A0A540WIC3_9BACT|nr:type VI immunity family protein [Myxococcus llanfairpwllgwyngyllgogerychwyrndrobwllllantysiliogogogochensis]TQF08733.1 DUF3396 domain-containing protein [Myxococcus llanfairpwllgwyngyllgogerychwyrndrobwllllantysiliogogogochensis]
MHAPPPSELELIQDGIRLTSWVFGINLYTSRSFYDGSVGLLSAWDLFQTRCPPERLTFHATETMKAHKPVTKRVLGLLGTWLAPDAPRKNYLTGTMEQLGGLKALRSQLPAEVELLEARHGALVKAGPAPMTGDVDHAEMLPLYREVYRLLAPWIAIAADQSMAMRLGGGAIPRTEAWYRRLGT